MSEKLTVKDMRNVNKAFERGVKATEKRLGDGKVLLRKKRVPVEDHDKLESELRKWLDCDNHGYRAPGVRDNLFRLSDYLSGRSTVPPKDTLLFLHAYIFALEGAHFAVTKLLREERKKNRFLDSRTYKPRKLRAFAEGLKEL